MKKYDFGSAISLTFSQRIVKDIKNSPYDLTKGVSSCGVAYKNQEGYADSVPFQALSNIEKEQRKYRPIVYICSPFSGDVERNLERARGYSRFAVDQGAIPIAPHLLLPQFMKEETERDLAMFMDIAILSKCKELWVFGKPTSGMQSEIAYAERKNMTIRYFDEKEI